jgi:hypothetical protein
MLVGFTGYKGSGKDTAARGLIRHGFHRIAFADKIKDLSKSLFNLTFEEMHHRELKEKVLDRWPYKSPREIMQTLGESMKNVAPDVWSKIIEDQYVKLAKQHQSVVIADIRFPHEFELVKSLGGTVYRVDRIGHRNDDVHVSEQYINTFDVDYVLANNFETPLEFEDYIFGIYQKIPIHR